MLNDEFPSFRHVIFFVRPGIAGRLPKIIIMVAGNAALAIAIYFLNKRAVKQQFIPQLNKIDELIAVMEKE
jgi:hypothetical protein